MLNTHSKQSIDTYLKVLTHPLFIAIGFTIVLFAYYYVDLSIAVYFHQLENHTFKSVAEFITKLGDGLYLIVGLIVLACLFKWVFKHRLATLCSLYLLLVVIITGLACNVLKYIFTRARPVEWFSHELYGFWFFKFKASFFSFPSGHSTTIMGLMVAASLLWPRLSFLFIPVALTVAFSRIILTAHYFSDVLAGLYLGTLGALLLFKMIYLRRLERLQ